MFLQIVLAVLALLVVLIIAILLLAATRPGVLRVERSTAINAPSAKIFPLINEFRQWGLWSPYEHRDPQLKRTYSGAASGVGSVYEWEGNSSVGQGRMEILQSSPPGKIVIKLDFIKPFEGHNTAEFTLAPQGNGTQVTWLMHGPANLMSKVMGLFMNFDRMIGKDFEAGLETMKTVAER
jgi:carbon monoxide dehydrogenase subunit G